MREFLISEIQRFYETNGRVPIKDDMLVCGGYPSYNVFIKEFGSWNNAVEAAGFKVRLKRIIGDEVCVICGAIETHQWYNSDDGKICMSCYERQESDYMNGLLDINSTVGFGFLCQRIVANKLGLEIKYDCNLTKGFQHPGYDLLQLDNEKYGEIQVKGATLRINDYDSLYWHFNIGDDCDNYIMLGFVDGISNIEKVWVVPSDRNIVVDKKTLSIYLNPKNVGVVAREMIKYEVDANPYNDAYHNMKKLDECDIFTKY